MPESSSSASPLEAALCTALLSALAAPVLYGLNTIESMHNEAFLFSVGVIVCTLIFFLSYKFVFARLPAHTRGDWYLAWFSLFAFTGIVDLLLAFNIRGDIHVMDWYLTQGEKYLLSAYGYAANLWDGTAHWFLYIVMVYALAAGSHQRFRPVYLIWVGSILFSLAAFLPGACVGAHSHDIKASSFLNVPYLLFPLFFLNRVLRQEPAPNTKQSHWIFSLLYTPLILASIVFIFVRFCAAAGSKWSLAEWWRSEYEPILEDDTRFFNVQAYVCFYYLLPYYFIMLYTVLFGSSGRGAQHVADLAALIAGGLAETQFCLLIGAFTSPLTPAQYLFPGINDEEKLAIYLGLSAGLMVVVPVLFALQCHLYPNFQGLLGGAGASAGSQNAPKIKAKQG